MQPFGVQSWRRGPSDGPVLLGHRGVRRSGVTENTIAAFELASQEGAVGVELDVRLDSNGGLIILHDIDLLRVTGKRDPRQVETVPVSELRRLPLEHGELIPSLSDALEWSRRYDQRINIELKHDVSDRRRLLQGVATAIARVSDAPERFVLSSFDPRLVLGLSLRLPEVACAWLVHDKQRVLRFAPGLRLTGAAGVHPQDSLLSRSSLARYRRRASFVGTWTVNDPKRARQLADWGVDTIISDSPALIARALAC